MKQLVKWILPIAAMMAFTPAHTATEPTSAQYETRMALRDLWVEHVFWVRNYVVASAAETKSAREQSEREVIANARAIADAIVPFYGTEAGSALFTLLGGHWAAIKDYDRATIQGSDRLQEAAVQSLTKNAQAIAKFLSGANPHLPEEAVFSLLSVHGSHHVAQINEIFAADFVAEAQTWSAMRHHMLILADTLTGGISQQFPERFQPAT